MSLQLSTARPNCRHKPGYGLVHVPPSGKNVSPVWQVCFRLYHGAGSKRHYMTLPVGTPERRARKVRAYLLGKIESGKIATPEDWTTLTGKLARKIRALNRRDGILPIKSGPKPKS